MFFHRWIVAAGLCAVIAGAYAATTVGSLEPTTGTWRAYRGTDFTTLVCSNSSEAAMLACVAADAERRATTTRYQLRYPNRYVTATYTAPAPVNRPPVISGTPATTVTAGNAYRFRPTASDPDGQTLTFSIENGPAWATFSASTGEISGTPAAANVGTYSNVIISVSDGRASVSLAPFAIAVLALPPVGDWTLCAVEYQTCTFTGTRRARFGLNASWVERDLTGPIACRINTFGGDPVPGAAKRCELRNVDTPPPPPDPTVTRACASRVCDVSWTPNGPADGFRVFYSRTDGTWANAPVQVAGNVSRTNLTMPETGVWYFAVKSFIGGTESALSNVVVRDVQ